MSDTVVNAIESEPTVSLKKFIDDYQKTISVIGVFVALGLFWKATSKTDEMPFLSYLCFFISVPLLLEVRAGFKGHGAEWRLVWFMDIFTAIAAIAAWHLFVDFPDQIGRTVANSIVFFALFFGGRAISRWEATKRVKVYTEYSESFELIRQIADMDGTKKNELLNARNLAYKNELKRRDRVQIALMIGSILFLVLLTSYVSHFVQAVIDIELMQKEPMEVVAPR